jgi:hypothetical protein
MGHCKNVPANIGAWGVIKHRKSRDAEQPVKIGALRRAISEAILRIDRAPKLISL